MGIQSQSWADAPQHGCPKGSAQKMKKSVTEKIVELEWEMFSNVSNVGGKASCQSDRQTFQIMRLSQAETWPEEVLASWLNDLETAQKDSRNLMSEKYAWMMESSFPDEFARISDKLPHIDEDALTMIEEMVNLNLDWKLATEEKYPFLSGRGRPLRATQDTPWGTSFETYLRGELKTYSPETVRRLWQHTRNMLQQGVNMAEMELLNQVRRYGYQSLEEAEQAQARCARF